MAAKTRVLIADSDLESLSRLYLKLLHKQIKTEATNTPDEILTRIQRFKPHIVLLNPLMVDNCPNAYCKKLKADFRLTPILLIDGSDKQNYLFDTLTKPVDFNVLMDMIELYRF